MISDANTELGKVLEWTFANRLTINVSKTEMLLITKRQVNRDNFSVFLDNTKLDLKDNCKFLGVFVDDNLNFSFHIKYIRTKLSRCAGILYRIRDYLPMEARLNFYYAFIFPYLSYNVIIWGGTNNLHIEPVIIQHKRIIRIICNSQRLDHTSPLFLQLGLLKFKDIYKFFMCVHMFKSLSEGQFQISHQLDTRNANLAKVEFHRLTLCQQAVSFRGPHIWNSLPLYLRKISSFSLFKKKLKSYFVAQYL